MKHLITFIGAALLLTGSANAAAYSQSFSMTTVTAIPDGDLNGVVQIINPTTIISTLDSLTVSLETEGGWNGDLYAYLWHDGKISILLNRVGRTTTNDDGSSTRDSSIMFTDVALVDVHGAPGGLAEPISGVFQPSGRDVDPLVALDTTPRTTPLSVFNGSPADGEYRLFIADTATGGSTTLKSWSVTITGSGIPAVPEPGSAALAALASLGLLIRRRR